jgi:TPR repeat protein
MKQRITTLLLLSMLTAACIRIPALGAAVQLPAQPTEADRQGFEEIKAKAEKGDAKAQLTLGVRLQHGLGVAKDAVEAVKWYRKAADQGFAEAQCTLGICYRKGNGVTKDPVEAVKWYRKAAEQGYAHAQYSLGYCYLNGEGLAKDAVEGVKWYRKAAEQGKEEAQYDLGVCYAHGYGVTKDPVEAVKWYRKAAEQNYAPAQFNLAVCYHKGQGVPMDATEAYKWLLLAGAQGFEVAKQGISEMERPLTPEQRAEGQKRAADSKLPEVQSLDFQEGEVDINLPTELLAKAQTGDAKAQNELGEALSAAANRGMMGNYVAAVKWFRQAAEQNYAEGQSNLGDCYERGDGVAKYEIEAYKWDLLAAAQGDSKGKRKASRLESMLPADQLAEGKRRAQAWLEERSKPSSGR